MRTQAALALPARRRPMRWSSMRVAACARKRISAWSSPPNYRCITTAPMVFFGPEEGWRRGSTTYLRELSAHPRDFESEGMSNRAIAHRLILDQTFLAHLGQVLRGKICLVVPDVDCSFGGSDGLRKKGVPAMCWARLGEFAGGSGRRSADRRAAPGSGWRRADPAG